MKKCGLEKVKRMLMIGSLWGFAGISISFAADKSSVTRSEMNGIFESYRQLAPFLYSKKAFSAKDNQGKISLMIKNLVKSSKRVNNHGIGQNGDDTYHYLAGKFATKLASIKSYYSNGDMQAAAFHLKEVLDNCVSCHTRIPETKNRQQFSSLFDLVDTKELDFAEKTQFLIASRKFAKAEALYREMFASFGSQENPLDPFLLPKYLTEYLILTLQVSYEPKKVTQTLTQLGKNGAVPEFLRADIQHWVTSVKDHPKKDWASFSVGKVAALLGVDLKKAETELRVNQRDLAKVILGASMLNRLLVAKENKLPNLERAKAYYLLGQLEKSMEANAFPTAMEFHFEKAIRTAPGTAVAKSAFSSLKEHIYFEHTGSSGTDVPQSQKDRLAGLKKISKI